MKPRWPLLALLFAVAAFALGVLAQRERWLPDAWLGPTPRERRASRREPAARKDPVSEPTLSGLWQRATHDAGPGGGDDETYVRELTELGYLAGYEPASSETGVRVHVAELCHEGLNYYTSGHGGEVILIDMDGVVRHTWSYDVATLLPPAGEGADAGYFRRAYVYGNGDALAIYDPRDLNAPERHLLLKLDRDSNLLWSHAGGAHHDLEVLADGRIALLTRSFRQEAELFDGRRVVDDAITFLDAHGRFERSVSILDCYLNSNFAAAALSTPSPIDLLHVNTIELLDGRLAQRSPAFRAGNVLISALHIDAVSVIDLEREQVVWSLRALWKNQHQPTVLDNGHLMVFDNRGHDGYSKVIELDPFTQEQVWSYAGDERNGFSSPALGSAMRLPNGNTLITESTAGRAFELTPDKRIVWEFLNPRRAGVRNELIAALCEVVRVAPDFGRDWLQ